MRFWTTDWSYNDFFNRLSVLAKFAFWGFCELRVTEFSEVRGRLCDGQLGSGSGAFYELLQIPHNPLRTLKGHRVACIGVHLEPRIGDRPRAPLLLLAPKDSVSLSPQDQGRRL